MDIHIIIIIYQSNSLSTLNLFIGEDSKEGNVH